MVVGAVTSSDPLPVGRARAEGGTANRKRYVTGPLPESGLPVALTAFNALLEVTRNSLADTVRLGRLDGTSPSLMFEPLSGDEHDRRLNSLKREFRSALLRGGSSGSADPTSVEARRAARDSGADGVNPGRALNRRASPDPQGDSGKLLPASTGRTARPATADAEGAGQPGSPRSRISPSEMNTVPRFREGMWTGQGNIRMGDYATSSYTETTGSARVVGGAALGGSPDTPTDRVAQQVGRILGAPRSGSTESGRAVDASPATGDTRGTSTQPKSASTSQGPGNGQAGTASRSVGQGADPGRSRFDELVRSIRLQTGARHSSARMQLDPPELGRMRVDVHLAGDRIQIDVRTETAEATELLHHRTAKLRAALELHGIFVERFDVSTDLAGFAGRDVGLSQGWDVGTPEREREWPTGTAGPPGGGPALEADETEIAGGAAPPASAAAPRLDIRI